MPLVLRMKHVVKSPDLGNPTIEELFRMYHESKIPVIRKQAAELIIKLNANPDDPANKTSAGYCCCRCATRWNSGSDGRN